MYRKLTLPIFVIVSMALAVLTQKYMYFPQVSADEVKELQQEIDKLTELKSLSENATKPLENQAYSLDVQIRNTHYSIIQKNNESLELQGNITESQASLVTQYALLNRLVADQYKSQKLLSPILGILQASSASTIIRGLMHTSIVSDYMTGRVGALAERIETLSDQKETAEELAERLAAQKTQLAGEAGFLKQEISKAKDYQSELGSKIASLTAKQQAIIAARSGANTTNATGVPSSGDYNATLEGFRANAPSGSFGVFSFGAYTHRKGMSQYGAKARADDGQDYKKILKEYYGKEPVDKDTGGTISVAGYGNLDFESYYLYGIAEMPSSWPLEALKAQAVAARTYAYRYKRDGKTICTTEACQVFNNGKAANPPDKWKQAVKETRGKILEDVITYYSAAAGGYVSPLGWDTTDGSGSGEWTKNAWEVKANSPWFYKSWYRSGYSDSGADCGRKPWLTEEEMADILNAYLLRQDSGSADMNRIVPVTIRSCSIGGQSGDPYSMSELRSLLDNPVTDISGKPSVKHTGSASTSSISFSTNRGTVSMSGAEFKEIFNTRAPGYLRIPQSGFAFFNVERK